MRVRWNALALLLCVACNTEPSRDPSTRSEPVQEMQPVDSGSSSAPPEQVLSAPEGTVGVLFVQEGSLNGWGLRGGESIPEILNRRTGLGSEEIELWTQVAGSKLEVVLFDPTRLRGERTVVTIRLLAETGEGAGLELRLLGLDPGAVSPPTTAVPPRSTLSWRELSFEVADSAQLDPLTLQFSSTGAAGGTVSLRALEVSLRPHTTELSEPEPPTPPDSSQPPVPFVVVGSAIKLRPDRPVEGGAAGAELIAARNEFESFQVAITATDEPITALRAELAGDLTTPGGAIISAEKVTVYRVGYHQVVSPSDLEGSRGRWPDPLIPAVDPLYREPRNAFPIDVPKGENRAVWVDIQVPIDATPGLYQGSLKLTAEGLASSVPIHLQVLPFTLPSTTSLKSAFGFNPGSECTVGAPGCSSSSILRADAKALFVRSALDNRITIASAHVTSLRAGSTTGLSEFRTYTLPFIKGTASTRLAGARLSTYQVNRIKEHNLAGWKAEAELQGFSDRVFIYACDEPHFFPVYGEDASNWALCRDELELAKAAWPEAPRLVTAHIQSSEANGGTSLVDLMVINEELLDGPKGTRWFEGNQRPLYDDFLQQGAARNKALWIYAACGSHGCTRDADRYNIGWAGYEIDAPASETRAIAWAAFRYSLSGTLYYDMALLLPSAWETQLYSTGNGDGTLFYPGTVNRIGGTHPIPIESLRMKLVRDGYEDYEYLKLLRDRGHGNEAHSLAASLFPTVYDTARTDAQVQAVRRKLAQRVAELLAAQP